MAVAKAARCFLNWLWRGQKLYAERQKAASFKGQPSVRTKKPPCFSGSLFCWSSGRNSVRVTSRVAPADSVNVVEKEGSR